MTWVVEELKIIYAIDLMRLRIKIFLFLFNIIPDLYMLKILKNCILLLAGFKLQLPFTYIRSGINVDNAKNITIGKGTFINRNVSFEGNGQIHIGNSVHIGPSTCFFTTNHTDRENDAVHDIHIGNNVWIGGGSLILPGAIISDNTIIAAGSVVRGTLSGGTLWAGTPAVKKR